MPETPDQENEQPLAFYRALVKSERVVERVPGFVSQVPHCLGVVFDRQGHLRLDALEPRIGQIERHTNEGCAIRATPLITQVHGGTKPQSFGLELGV